MIQTMCATLRRALRLSCDRFPTLIPIVDDRPSPAPCTSSPIDLCGTEVPTLPEASPPLPWREYIRPGGSADGLVDAKAAALRLGLTVEALRRLVRRNMRRRASGYVATLGDGVSAIRLGRRWRFRFEVSQ